MVNNDVETATEADKTEASVKSISIDVPTRSESTTYNEEHISSQVTSP